MQTSLSSDTIRRLIIGGIVATIALIGLLFLESFFRPMAHGGQYFQRWSSETMMQTVSIEDLRNDPIQSLWNIHIQPPAFDTLRAILASIVGSDDALVTLWRVDYCLYLLWAALYCMTVFVMFYWLSDMTSIAFAAGATLLFAAHPAVIFYATLLETTFMSAFLILCFCYLLWRIKTGRSVSAILLATSFLALYFTRSIFQWHWLLLLPVCLIMLRYPRRKILIFLAITLSIVGLYTAKQMALFSLSSTSSFTGLNLCNSIGIADAWKFYNASAVPARIQDTSFSPPHVLSRVKKVNGALNYNNRHYLDINRKLQKEYRKQLLTNPKQKLAAGMLSNLRIYFQPSSHYTPHIIVDNIPWRAPYDYMFSSPFLPFIMGIAALFWLRREKYSAWFGTIGLCLPVISIMLISVIFERGENMRFKFFLEPVFFCFVASTTYIAGGQLKNVLTRKFRRLPGIVK